MLFVLTVQQSLVKALQFLKDHRFDFSSPSLIIHQRMPTDTDLLRRLPDSQPCTEPQNSQSLTIGHFISRLSAQKGIPRLLPTDIPRRAAPECEIPTPVYPPAF